MSYIDRHRFGLVALLFQMFVFERLLRTLKIVRLYGMGLSVMAISTFVVPTGGLIYWWLGALLATPPPHMIPYLLCHAMHVILPLTPNYCAQAKQRSPRFWRTLTR